MAKVAIISDCSRIVQSDEEDELYEEVKDIRRQHVSLLHGNALISCILSAEFKVYYYYIITTNNIYKGTEHMVYPAFFGMLENNHTLRLCLLTGTKFSVFAFLCI